MNDEVPPHHTTAEHYDRLTTRDSSNDRESHPVGPLRVQMWIAKHLGEPSTPDDACVRGQRTDASVCLRGGPAHRLERALRLRREPSLEGLSQLAPQVRPVFSERRQLDLVRPTRAKDVVQIIDDVGFRSKQEQRGVEQSDHGASSLSGSSLSSHVTAPFTASSVVLSSFA